MAPKKIYNGGESLGNPWKNFSKILGKLYSKKETFQDQMPKAKFPPGIFLIHTEISKEKWMAQVKAYEIQVKSIHSDWRKDPVLSYSIPEMFFFGENVCTRMASGNTEHGIVNGKPISPSKVNGNYHQ